MVIHRLADIGKTKGRQGMSKYTEYREIAGKEEILFEENIGDKGRYVRIRLKRDDLRLQMIDDYGYQELGIESDTGLALFKALKQIYE
jgi:hypothetical protein